LFRLGIASDVFCAVILSFVTLAFYRLFKALVLWLLIMGTKEQTIVAPSA
jgi:hypothetical protein